MDEQTQRLTKVMELRASQERAERAAAQIEARRQHLNDRWRTKYDHQPPLYISEVEHEERDRLNRDFDARQKAPTPPAPQPRPARSTVSAKNFKALGNAAADAVAREINELRRERELYAAKVGEALARLEAVIARVEAKA